MTINSNLEDLLRSLDPLTEELDQKNDLRREAVWATVQAKQVPTPARPRVRRWRLIGVSSLATVGAAVALVVDLLPGTAPLSAAAAILRQAAFADESAATLPSLAAGQYYYQQTQVSMICQFAKAGGTGENPWISYVSKGAMQSWTSPNSVGQIVITPTPVNEGGSHFATPADEARWVGEGKPFVPCALLSSSNALVGNPANANTWNSRGGYAASVSGYSGLGFVLGVARQATPVNVNGVPVSSILGGTQSPALRAGTNVTILPSNVASIESMLANGEINPDGSVASSPQVCPLDAAPNAAPGCNPDQQLALIEQLLQLPTASAKFGSVLYDVLAQMPGATVAKNTTDSFGNVGSTVTVPVGGSGATAVEEFQVVLDPTTGALLSSTALDRVAPDGTTSTTYTPMAAVSYGTISVVNSIGAQPAA